MGDIDLNKLQTICKTYSMVDDVSTKFATEQSKMFDSINKANEERRKKEEKDTLNLQIIANNSEETVKALKESNELLKENNQLLREKNEELNSRLGKIKDIIDYMAEISKEASENQEDLMKQALDLVLQLNITEEKNGNINWKEFLTNSSVSVVLLGLQVFLHQRGLM